MLKFASVAAVAGMMAFGVYGATAIFFPSLLPGVTGLADTPHVPSIINHQGVVSVSGVRFTGTGQFRFAIMNVDSGLNLWTNDGSQIGGSSAPTNAVSLTVTDGIYKVGLGDTSLTNMTAVPTSIFSNSKTSLRIWFNDGINGWQQLSPDHALTSVPYAFRAETVSNGAITPASLSADVAVVPVGAIEAYAFSSAPAGWLLCDGSALTTANPAHAALRQKLIDHSNPFGVSGTDPLLPDLRGRVPAGKDNMGGTAANRLTSELSGISASTLGATGGNERMQTHNHGVTDPGHVHGPGAAGWDYILGYVGVKVASGGINAGDANRVASTTASAATGISIQNSGAGSSQNVQPTIVLNYIIKY